MRRRHSGDPIQVPDGHRDRALSRQGHNHVVRNVRLPRRIGAEEGEREVDRLDERGAARERIRDQFPDRSAKLPSAVSPARSWRSVGVDAELDGRLVDSGDVPPAQRERLDAGRRRRSSSNRRAQCSPGHRPSRSGTHRRTDSSRAACWPAPPEHVRKALPWRQVWAHPPQRGVVGLAPPPTQEPGRCPGVSSSRSRRIE